MDNRLQSIRILLASRQIDVGTNGVLKTLSLLGRDAIISENEAWKTIIEISSDELESLADHLRAAEPRIVPESEGSQKLVILNHLNLEQTALVASLMELMVAWGIAPFISFSIPRTGRSEGFLGLCDQLPPSVVVCLSETYSAPLAALKALYSCLSCRELFELVVDGALVDVIPALVKFGFERTSLDASAVQWCNTAFKQLMMNPVVPSASMARLLLHHLSLKPNNAVAVRVLSSSLYMLICERMDGLTGTLSALLDSSSGVVNLELVQAAATTIASPPERIQMEGYMAKLCPQLLTILRGPRNASNDKYVACAAEIFRTWSITQPILTARLWLNPLFSPLLPFILLYRQNLESESYDPLVEQLSSSTLQSAATASKSTKPKIQFVEEILSSSPTKQAPTPDVSNFDYDLERWTDSEGVVVSHQILESLMANILLLLHSIGDSSALPLFEPIIPAVVTLYDLSLGNKRYSAVEKSTSSILHRFFLLTPPDQAIKLLERLALNNKFNWRGLYRSNQPFRFEIAEVKRADSNHPELAIEASKLGADPQEDIIMDARDGSRQLISLLKLLDSEMIGVFFLKLLETLFTTSTKLKTLSTDQSSSFQSINLEERLKIVALLTEKQLSLLHTLMPLLEQLGTSVLRNTVQICVFIKNMLENDDGEELHALLLSILKELLESKFVSAIESDILLVDMLSPLKPLFSHPNDFISQLAQHCYEQIVAYRKATISDDVMVPQTTPASTSSSLSDSTPLTEPNLKRKWVLNPHADTVDSCLKMISNPLVPIRAGGLIQLRRFLLREDPEAMSQLPHILETFVRHLENEDSYVYLGAIQGLSAIADVQFSLAMPKLSDQYRNTGKSLEVRLNVGEAVLQVARRLGGVLPKYASEFFALLLTSAQKDPEALIRASSLSNIAEVCEILQFGLLPYIEEIMAMVYEILLIEKDEHVRRGCLQLVQQLFKGLKKEILVVLPTHLKRLTALLESISESDRDLILREHAKLALERYHTGIEHALEDRLERESGGNANPLLLEPRGFYDSLRIVK